MQTKINRFELELLAASRKFLDASDTEHLSLRMLEEHGFSAEQRLRGRTLIAQTEAAFAAARAGREWNFLTPTPWARRKEALDWFVDTRWRRFRRGFVAFERAIAGRSVSGALRAFGPSVSLLVLASDQATLVRDLVRAGFDRPVDAPPPKDTTLVELQGWYEHWRLLAQRLFRQRPDLLAPFGLVPGKAPPRLRGKLAQIRFGEGAAARDARFEAAAAESAGRALSRSPSA
jgi:hypothetical protein